MMDTKKNDKLAWNKYSQLFMLEFRYWPYRYLLQILSIFLFLNILFKKIGRKIEIIVKKKIHETHVLLKQMKLKVTSIINQI